MLAFLHQAGVRIIQTPFRAPNCNAYAERFVRSIKEECLERVILLGERHLRCTIAEFVTHDHSERNHQGIGNELIQPLDRANDKGPWRVSTQGLRQSFRTLRVQRTSPRPKQRTLCSAYSVCIPVIATAVRCTNDRSRRGESVAPMLSALVIVRSNSRRH